MFKTHGLTKLAELDNYGKGITGRASECFVEIPFSCLTVNGLIDQISEFVGCYDYMINPCEDDPSRIDWKVLENAKGDQANKKEIERWKKGELDLYSCTYTVFVEESKPVDLSEYKK